MGLRGLDANLRKRVLHHELAGPDDALCISILVDRANALAGMERNEFLVRERVDAQAIRIEREEGMGRRAVA
ncbi:hypothetical protein CWC26_21535, partial [Pseudoalteromonas sp. S4488]